MFKNLPSIAVGTVTLLYTENGESKSKSGMFIGTEEALKNPEAHLAEIKGTCERLGIPFENVTGVKLEGTILHPPEGLEEALNSEANLGAPHTEGLTVH